MPEHEGGRTPAERPIEDTKASGSVRRTLDNAGLKTSTVAPAEKKCPVSMPINLRM